MADARVLVAGVGNIFLADDGFGVEVVRRLASLPLPDGVLVVDYGIGGIHLAYDLLDGYDSLVLVDAVPAGGRPGDIVIIEVGPGDLGGGSFDAHSMDPAAVLSTLTDLGGTLPHTLLVGCEPAELDERIGLSATVAAAVDLGVETVRRLIEEELARPVTASQATPSEGALTSWP